MAGRYGIVVNVWDSARTLHQNTAYVYHVAVCFQQKPVESSVKVTESVAHMHQSH